MYIKSFDIFTIYLGVKNHLFTKYYDFYKYNKKINIKLSTFETRNDKKFFSVLSYKFKNIDNLKHFFIGNFKERGNIHISDLVDDKSFHYYYSNHCDTLNKIYYYFDNDLKFILSQMKNNNRYIIKGGIFKDYVSNKIKLESLSFFNIFFGIYDIYDSLNDLLYDNIKIFLKKYCIYLTNELSKEKLSEIKKLSKEKLNEF